jgi:6-phosphogluconolactonase
MIPRLKVTLSRWQLSLFVFLFGFLGFTGEGYSKDIFLLVGTYTPHLYVYRFNTDTGKLALVSTLDIKGAQYLAVAGNKKYVYVANDKSDTKGGEITALAFDNKKGILTRINAVPTGSEPSCFVDAGIGDKWVVAGSYRLGI